LVASHPNVAFIGEISEAEKANFLGNARALLFPIDWPEPFGLVMIEAMACGTPTIAFRCGSVPEVIDDGVSGFIVDDLAAATAAVKRVDELERAKIRAAFEKRFTVERMADEYLTIYRNLPGLRAGGASPRGVSGRDLGSQVGPAGRRRRDGAEGAIAGRHPNLTSRNATDPPSQGSD
jgi:hypothetical protein